MWRRLRYWYTRPAGGQDAIRIALPLVISTSSWTMLHFIDRMMLFWHSSDSLAAALPAGLLNFTFVCFFLGVAAYTNSFVAKYYGARRHERIGLAV